MKLCGYYVDVDEKGINQTFIDISSGCSENKRIIKKTHEMYLNYVHTRSDKKVCNTRKSRYKMACGSRGRMRTVAARGQPVQSSWHGVS